jgi:hypothetical protein
MAMEEFKFPDEQVVKKGKEMEEEKVEFEIEGEDTTVKVEIKDDTPAEDKGRRPMSEAPEEVTEEELLKYKDVKLRDRLAHLNKGYHEERRAKERAERERDRPAHPPRERATQGQRQQQPETDG